MDPDASIPPEPAPSVLNYVLSFLLVGVAWGFTTPFIRRAAADFTARQEKQGTTTSTRGRSLSHENDEEESALLVPVHADGDGEGGGELRRRSSSQQRAEQEGEDGRVDEAPLPAWRSRSPRESWLKSKIISVFWTVVNLLRTPAYSVPLVINLTGSVWFFLLVGKHGRFNRILDLDFDLEIEWD
jgi:hypothetical protein